MQTSKYPSAVRPVLKKYLRSSSPRSRNRHNCDPEPDCCGRLPKKPKRNPEEPFMERDCFPDIYKTWRPKIPKLIPTPCIMKKEPPCFVTRTCCAGMKGPPSVTEQKLKAKECQDATALDAINKQSNKPEVIIISSWSQKCQNRHIFLTDFAYKILLNKRPRSRRIRCSCCRSQRSNRRVKIK